MNNNKERLYKCYYCKLSFPIRRLSLQTTRLGHRYLCPQCFTILKLKEIINILIKDYHFNNEKDIKNYIYNILENEIGGTNANNIY